MKHLFAFTLCTLPYVAICKKVVTRTPAKNTCMLGHRFLPPDIELHVRISQFSANGKSADAPTFTCQHADISNAPRHFAPAMTQYEPITFGPHGDDRPDRPDQRPRKAGERLKSRRKARVWSSEAPKSSPVAFLLENGYFWIRSWFPVLYSTRAPTTPELIAFLFFLFPTNSHFTSRSFLLYTHTVYSSLLTSTPPLTRQSHHVEDLQQGRRRVA